MLNIEAIYAEGMRRIKRRERQEEDDKSGGLRGGSVGLLDEGCITGKCHRLALARKLGLVVEMDANAQQREKNGAEKELMFEAGHTSEDSWLAVLKEGHKGVILREEQIPIAWNTQNGTAVTGRPDFVLCDKKKKPQHGLELKLVCSLWTGVSALEGKPKATHLIQAGHYSWKLGYLPWDLWYTSRVDWHVLENWRIMKRLPKHGKPGSEVIQWEERGRKVEGEDGKKKIVKGWEPKKILPFRTGFTTRWNKAGELEVFHLREDGHWITTIISSKRINDYYEFVSTMEAQKTLGPRPLNLEVDGSYGGYSPCAYCPLQTICTEKEKDFEGWMAAVKELDGKNRTLLQRLWSIIST